MLYVRVLRRNGVRIPHEEAARQPSHAGDFIMDMSGGARRLRLKNPWTGYTSPIELYEPMLVAAGGGSQRWRGYERVGEQGLVQEWLVRQEE